MLTLPNRTKKPRKNGLTFVLDKGLGLNQVKDLLETSHPYIDIVKLGWGTGYITLNLKKKIELYQKYDVPVCFGGTFFEVCCKQKKLDFYEELVKKHKIKHIEISDGTVNIPKKLDLISQFSKDYTVISEVGKKADVDIEPGRWADQIKSELDAGSWKVITEGRASGTVGIYSKDKEVKYLIIDAITKKIDYDKIVFEAPNKSQQVFFIKKFGSNVNLGNIAHDDVIPLETLRLGLRGDTVNFF